MPKERVMNVMTSQLACSHLFLTATSNKRFKEKMVLTNRMINFEIILQAAREDQWLGSKKLKSIDTGSHFKLYYRLYAVMDFLIISG